MRISLNSHFALLSPARYHTGSRGMKYDRKCKMLVNAVPESPFAESCTRLYIFQYISHSNQGKERGWEVHIESHGQNRTQPRWQTQFQTSCP